jgi:hypothetical protein
LQDHGIQLPVVQSPNGFPGTTSTLPRPDTPVLKGEQRIALFRSLFHGRDDVYAVRWENADGRSGYMPKADCSVSTSDRSAAVSRTSLTVLQVLSLARCCLAARLASLCALRLDIAPR